jgi:hypothetical protein
VTLSELKRRHVGSAMGGPQRRADQRPKHFFNCILGGEHVNGASLSENRLGNDTKCSKRDLRVSGTGGSSGIMRVGDRDPAMLVRVGARGFAG